MKKSVAAAFFMRVKSNTCLKLKIAWSSQVIEFNCVTKFLLGFGDR